MRWEGHVACMGERRGVYKVLVRKSGGKRPIGRPRHIWEDNIKMDLQEVGCGDMDWIEWMNHKMASWSWTHYMWNIVHTALPDKSGTSSWNLEMSVPGTVFWMTLDYSCNISVVSVAAAFMSTIWHVWTVSRSFFVYIYVCVHMLVGGWVEVHVRSGLMIGN